MCFNGLPLSSEKKVVAAHATKLLTNVSVRTACVGFRSASLGTALAQLAGGRLPAADPGDLVRVAVRAVAASRRRTTRGSKKR